MIKDKRVGTRLYGEGFFGNRLRQFKTPEEAAEAKPHLLMLRQRKEHGGGICVKDLTVEAAHELYYSLPDRGTLYFSEQVKNQPENIVLQGEYMLGEEEYLWFSTAKLFHREAMELGMGYSGAGCRLIMQQAMDMASYENMMTLAECYPEHVIEFTTCNEPIGNLGLNTIIWEVRLY